MDMAEIMTEAAVVVARLRALQISNDDPMRQTKRALKQEADSILSRAVNQAGHLLDLIDLTEWDLKNAATKEGDGHAD